MFSAFEFFDGKMMPMVSKLSLGVCPYGQRTTETGLFLESPDNFSGPKSCFMVAVGRLHSRSKKVSIISKMML